MCKSSSNGDKLFLFWRTEGWLTPRLLLMPSNSFFFDSVKIAALALVCTSHGEQPGHTSFSPELMCNQITRQQLLRESQNRGGAPQGFANLSHPFLTWRSQNFTEIFSSFKKQFQEGIFPTCIWFTPIMLAVVRTGWAKTGTAQRRHLHVGGRNSQLIEPPILPPRVYTGRKLESQTEARNQTQMLWHGSWNIDFLTGMQNTCSPSGFSITFKFSRNGGDSLEMHLAGTLGSCCWYLPNV